MNTCITRAIVAIVTTCFTCHAQEAFFKDLNGTIQVSVSRYGVKAFHTNETTSSATNFVVDLMLNGHKVEPLWTNLVVYGDHPGFPSWVSKYDIFDAALADNELELCYNRAGFFAIDEFADTNLGASGPAVVRVVLSKEQIGSVNGVLTNAGFGVTTNGNLTLTARYSGNGVLVWEYRNHAWSLIEQASKPESAIYETLKFSKEWGQFELQHGIWKGASINFTNFPW